MAVRRLCLQHPLGRPGDTLKCRRYGFLDFVDSEGMLRDRLTALRQAKILP